MLFTLYCKKIASGAGYFLKRDFSYLSFVTDLNMLASRIPKKGARRPKNSTVGIHGTETVTLVRYTLCVSLRKRVLTKRSFALAQKACIDFLRLGESAESRTILFRVADSRSVPCGSELPRCVLYNTTFWNHFKFWQTRLFLAQLPRIVKT